MLPQLLSCSTYHIAVIKHIISTEQNRNQIISPPSLSLITLIQMEENKDDRPIKIYSDTASCSSLWYAEKSPSCPLVCHSMNKRRLPKGSDCFGIYNLRLSLHLFECELWNKMAMEWKNVSHTDETATLHIRHVICEIGGNFCGKYWN